MTLWWLIPYLIGVPLVFIAAARWKRVEGTLTTYFPMFLCYFVAALWPLAALYLVMSETTWALYHWSGGQEDRK